MKKHSLLPDELIINKIILLQDQKVLLDRDLAQLYCVETRVLNQAVKRNIKRFPYDFMFQMTNEEILRKLESIEKKDIEQDEKSF